MRMPPNDAGIVAPAEHVIAFNGGRHAHAAE